MKPTAGEIFYKGKRSGAIFKNEVGIQFQNTELPQFLTVKETLLTFRSLYDRKADVGYLIETCRLEDILKRDNRKISGGQKQRLLLAMALANDPELLFLDEPTTGLDPQARRHLWDIVRRIKAMKKTIVLTTHYMEEAEILCDMIGIIDNGKIIAMGTPQGLLKEHCGGATISLRADLDDSIMRDFPAAGSANMTRSKYRPTRRMNAFTRLVELGVDLSTMNVRNQNLEDLFPEINRP